MTRPVSRRGFIKAAALAALFGIAPTPAPVKKMATGGVVPRRLIYLGDGRLPRVVTFTGDVLMLDRRATFKITMV